MPIDKDMALNIMINGMENGMAKSMALTRGIFYIFRSETIPNYSGKPKFDLDLTPRLFNGKSRT